MGKKGFFAPACVILEKLFWVGDRVTHNEVGGYRLSSNSSLPFPSPSRLLSEIL